MRGDVGGVAWIVVHLENEKTRSFGLELGESINSSPYWFLQLLRDTTNCNLRSKLPNCVIIFDLAPLGNPTKFINSVSILTFSISYYAHLMPLTLEHKHSEPFSGRSVTSPSLRATLLSSLRGACSLFFSALPGLSYFSPHLFLSLSTPPPCFSLSTRPSLTSIPGAWPFFNSFD